MNIAFFLTPKLDTVWLTSDASVRDAIERMEHHGLTALPVLDEHGAYVSTLTEGDLLRKVVRGARFSVRDLDRVRLSDVPVLRTVRAVGIEAQVEELFSRALEQNFVPVVDSRDVFVGIVRRREILVHCSHAFATQQRGSRA